MVRTASSASHPVSPDPSPVDTFIQQLKQNPEKPFVIANTAEQGVIWEKVWTYAHGRYNARVQAGAASVDTYDIGEAEAIQQIRHDFELVDRTRKGPTQ